MQKNWLIKPKNRSNMKKIPFLLMLTFVVMATMASAKEKKNTIEVLYFKANLACCKAKACNTLEGKVKELEEANMPTTEPTNMPINSILQLEVCHD